MSGAAFSVVPRARFSLLCWRLLWFSAGLLLACEVMDASGRAAPLPIWVIKLAPLLVVLPGVLRDRLRAVVWLCFISLLYFVAAVQRVFAEPGSPRAVLELLAVVLLFSSAMLYVRYRARELRTGEDDRA